MKPPNNITNAMAQKTPTKIPIKALPSELGSARPAKNKQKHHIISQCTLHEQSIVQAKNFEGKNFCGFCGFLQPAKILSFIWPEI